MKRRGEHPVTMYRLANESSEYRALRDELARAAIALKEQCERVAELRRRLNRGARLETDYVFRERPRDLAAGDVARFRSCARSRGWRNVRLLGDGSALKRALGFAGPEGGQMPGVSVFTRSADGGVRHFYSGGAFLGEGYFRGMDLLSPVWIFLDLTPDVRGDWMPKRSYDG
jgi:predicted dithiol-disulfide oxidoreductase (DUF899 family)